MTNLNITKLNGEDQLLDYLATYTPRFGRVGILGGHFIIDYDPQKKVLAPLIVEDIEDKNFSKVATIEAGEFPFCSFQYSFRLFNSLTGKNFQSNIILLVNDHKTPFLVANKKTELLPQLRDKYYLRNSIPACYTQLVNEKGIDPNDVFLKNSIKPAIDHEDSFLFSEKYFRKRFDKALKGKVLATEGFFAKIGKSGKSEIFIELDNGENYCMSENGTCGCSGEIMHFLYSLVCKESIYDFVLFVPYECALGVSNGVYAIMKYLTKSGLKISVRVITGLPCDNHSKMFPDSPVIIEEFDSK